MSFHEKSIWVTLIITLAVFGFYFTQAAIVFINPELPDEMLIGLFIAVIVFVIILQIILQSIIAIIHRKEAEKNGDERDKLIELKATQTSYFVLVFGILTTCISILIIRSPLIIANLMLFFFIAAETTGYIKQLYHYRRGV
jgi:amino acid transporter